MDEAKRTMYETMRFVMEYSLNGDTWTYTVFMPGGMSKTFQYNIGQEFDSTTLDGRPIIVNINVLRFA